MDKQPALEGLILPRAGYGEPGYVEAALIQQIDAMREHGITRYAWTLGGSDDCFECRTREGEIFSVDDGWEEVHPHCDCYPTPISKEVQP